MFKLQNYMNACCPANDFIIPVFIYSITYVVVYMAFYIDFYYFQDEDPLARDSDDEGDGDGEDTFENNYISVGKFSKSL